MAYNQYPPPNNGQWQQPYYPPPHKRPIWPWIVFGVLALLILIFLGGCALIVGVVGKAAGDTATELSTPRDVQIEISTSGTGHVTYSVRGSASTEDVGTEWSKTIPDVKPTDIFTANVIGDLTDQNAHVSCKLVIDGKVRVEQTGDGSGATAACTLPVGK